MSKTEKENTCNTYICPSKIFFSIAVLFVVVYWVVCAFAMPGEKDVISTDCELFEAQWERVMQDGKRVPVQVPGSVEAQWGEVVTLTTTLPNDIYNGETLCFRPIWQDVSVYVNGERRLSYSTEDSRPFGTNSAMRYLFVELTEADRGGVLTYQFSSNSKYAGNMQHIYIGDRASVWIYMLQNSGFRTMLAVALIMLSVFCLVVTWVMKLVYKKPLPLCYLAWTICLAAIWMLSESDFRQLLFDNISVLSNLTYWCLMLIPFPLIIYINDVQGNRYRKLYMPTILYTGGMTVVGTVLQMFDVAQFVHQIPFIHAGLIAAIVSIIITITMDAFKKRLKQYLAVGIGIYGMLLTAVLEMLLYYYGATISLGTILGIGLLFLLVMAIIKTGQDLFETEKNKQEAIVAREAQAKFLANMSHEIRTPINAIIGMNEMILRENESEAVEDYAHNIQSASKMLLGLVNDVLDFSKIESGQLELVEDTYHLGALLQDVVLLMNARAAGKPISTNVDIDPKLPSKYLGDELRIKQILTNIVSNAVKYTKEGSITLKVDYITVGKDEVLLRMAVKDTGIGIKEEDLPKLFDGFKRLELDKNRNIQGTGLGLNIAKQLATFMRGDITVESEYGVGSTFVVTIPQKIMDKRHLGSLKDSVNENRKENNMPVLLFTAPKAKVLVVDDNGMNLSLMKGLLKRTRMQVDVAKSGQECLEFTKDQKYDMIFMDHMMPEMDGVETLRLLRSNQSNPNREGIVIALTANAIAGCREMYLGYGFNDYFAKPIQADKLDELIVQYLPKELVNIREEA